ncbi:flagellar export protein FliJ [Pusillimonas sp. TS35]|uniref:flagellar export protein FliJ n=1 Tax=Paracandidimonas lactea TaxID=2895524 RepID=UPI0013686DC6|nr:flagellar export protein FliJ [Paracandidimonas lactea]MYN11655.1 flagellar export protein FliJ [Pusillimonas sp. TS35]
MAERASLKTLIDLAQEGLEGAGRHLRGLMDERRSAEQQLSMLQGYRMDYVERLQRAGELGISASNYQNFNRFIATLDQAIMQQNKVLAQLDIQVNTGREHWRDQKKRLNSFEALESRHQQQLQHRENRAEQRRYDEHSAILYRRRQQQNH